jgi:hypothetical protein
MERDWFAILVVVLEIVIILTVAALVYSACHSY